MAKRVKFKKQKYYAINIPNLPDPEKDRELAVKTSEFILGLRGLAGVHPHYPDGTFLFFDTLLNARVARTLFVKNGNECGEYVMEAEMDNAKNCMVILGTVERCRSTGGAQ